MNPNANQCQNWSNLPADGSTLSNEDGSVLVRCRGTAMCGIGIKLVIVQGLENGFSVLLVQGAGGWNIYGVVGPRAHCTYCIYVTARYFRLVFWLQNLSDLFRLVLRQKVFRE